MNLTWRRSRLPGLSVVCHYCKELRFVDFTVTVQVELIDHSLPTSTVLSENLKVKGWSYELGTTPHSLGIELTVHRHPNAHSILARRV